MVWSCTAASRYTGKLILAPGVKNLPLEPLEKSISVGI